MSDTSPNQKDWTTDGADETVISCEARVCRRCRLRPYLIEQHPAGGSHSPCKYDEVDLTDRTMTATRVSEKIPVERECWDIELCIFAPETKESCVPLEPQLFVILNRVYTTASTITRSTTSLQSPQHEILRPLACRSWLYHHRDAVRGC